MKKLFSARYSDASMSIGIFFLRVAAGGLMIPHGYSKLQNFSKMSSRFADPFGLGPTVSLSLSIFAEFVCAILIIIGLATRLATIAPIINMAVAVFIAHKGDIFDTGETAALFLAIFVTILFTGPGKYSVDGMIGK